MFFRWVSTVYLLNPNLSAISSVVNSSAISFIISFSFCPNTFGLLNPDEPHSIRTKIKTAQMSLILLELKSKQLG
jgi:hypothetical protein